MDASGYQAAYTRAISAGDEKEALAVVEAARGAGMDAAEIYFKIFAPSMVAIGDLWENNELSVAEEHLATAITERLIGRLGADFVPAAGPRQRAGTRRTPTVVLGCVAGEHHTLGGRMLADLFRRRSWRVLYLGADVPGADWVALAARTQADAAAISASAPRHAPAVRQLVGRLRASQPALKILVGGAAFDQDPGLWREVGADVYDADPAAAAARLEELLAPPARPD